MPFYRQVRLRKSDEDTVDRDHYSDDPIYAASSRRGRSTRLFPALALLLGTTFFLQTTLASNISLNSGASVEFGQGILRTVACSGSTNLTVTPNSTFVNASSGGAYYFSSFTVSNIPTSCHGKNFTMNAYGDAGNSPLGLFNSTSTNAVIYNNAGTFQAGAGSTGLSVTSGSGSFTATFTNPVALSSAIYKITIQSSDSTRDN